MKPFIWRPNALAVLLVAAGIALLVFVAFHHSPVPSYKLLPSQM